MFLFSVNDNYFAFDIDKVQEVAEPRGMTAIPGTIGYLKGAMNYKGSLYLIIDTASLFLSTPLDSPDTDIIIIISDKEFRVGFLADSIIGAISTGELSADGKSAGEISAGELSAEGKSAGEINAGDFFYKGFFEHNGRSVKLIDCKRVLSAIERTIDDSNYRQA